MFCLLSRRLAALAVAGVVVLAGCAGPPDAAPATLRVLTYNIHHGRGLDGRIDLARIARVIERHAPDLVALQEVDQRTTRAQGVDQAAELARITGMHHVYGKAMDYAGGAYGEALLSRFPLDEPRTHDLGRVRGSEPRALLVARIDLPDLGPVIFAGTHLAHDAEEDRVDQMRRIDDILRSDGGTTPTILAGDLNATPGSPPMRVLTEHWTDAAGAHGRPRPTFPSIGPDRRIDYVLVRPATRFRIRDVIVIEDEAASDHCPVLVELDVAPR